MRPEPASVVAPAAVPAHSRRSPSYLRRLLALLLLVGGPAAWGEVRIQEARETYLLTADTPKAFRAQVAERVRGPRTHGLVVGSIESGYQLWPLPGDRCELQRVEVTAQLQWSLPAWTARATAEPELAAAVDATLADIEHHGAQHRAQVLASAARLEAQLRDLRSTLSCNAMRSAAEALRRRGLVELRQAGRRLDEAIRHRHALLEAAKKPRVVVAARDARSSDQRETARRADHRLGLRP